MVEIIHPIVKSLLSNIGKLDYRYKKIKQSACT